MGHVATNGNNWTEGSLLFWVWVYFNIKNICSPNSLLWGSLCWPRYALATSPELVRHVSATCPPCVRLASTMCPPCVRLDAAVAASPHFVRDVSALCPPFACLVSALCLPWVRFGRASKSCPPYVHFDRLVSYVFLWVCLVSVHHVSAMCPLFVSPGPPCVLASGPCPLVACCGAGPWRHEVKFFSALRNPPRLYCMPARQFPWHSLWPPKFGLCKRTLCLKNCLGSMLVYIF